MSFHSGDAILLAHARPCLALFADYTAKHPAAISRSSFILKIVSALLACSTQIIASGAARARRVDSSVAFNDSLGSLRMIGSMIQASAVGTSRVREIARHSTNVPSSLSANRQ